MAENIPFIGFFGLQRSRTVCDSFKKNLATIDVYGRGDVAARFPSSYMETSCEFHAVSASFLGKMNVVCIE
jgi:hypothetical protein